VSYFYFAIHKPYGYLSQFSGEETDLLLGQLYDFPKDVYPIGRLDKDSEGLLLLTNDNRFKTKLLSPDSKIGKTYWVQVEGDISTQAVEKLSSGKIIIKHKGKEHKVAPADCKIIETPSIDERVPPIRYRKNKPTSWISLTITEGKNRQIRKMTAAVGHPTLRLIRYSIEGVNLDTLAKGEVVNFKPFK